MAPPPPGVNGCLLGLRSAERLCREFLALTFETNETVEVLTGRWTETSQAGGPQGGKAGAMCNESCPCKVSHVQTLPAVVLHYFLQPLLPSLATLHCSELAQNDQLSLHGKYDFKPVQALQGTLCGLQFSDRVLRA